MKKTFRLNTGFLILCFLLFFAGSTMQNVYAQAAAEPADEADAGDIESRLAALDGVVSVESVFLVPFVTAFEKKYIVTFSQPLDWEHPELGSFPQRVEFGYNSGAEVNAMNTEGYLLMDDYLMIGIAEDLVTHYSANFIHPEHRFFGRSKPEDLSSHDTRYWEYLTAENSAKDLHKIYTEFAKILGDTWFAYGTSYGGLMTNIYGHFFPDDMKLYVPCVAPCALSTHDERMYDFIYNEIGDSAFGPERGKEMRQLVTDFQVDLLRNKEALLPAYEEKIKESGLSFTDFATPDRLFDVNVLEFAVQLWQSFQPEFSSIENVLSLPETTPEEKEAKMSEELSLLLRVQNFEDWSTDFMAWPYYAHTQLEIGRQLYNFSYLRKALADAGLPDTLSVKEEEDETLYANIVLTGEQQEALVYDPAFTEALNASIDTTGAKHLMLYGATDPWTSLRIHDTDNENVKVYIHPTGTHISSAISNYPDEQQDELWAYMDSCLF